MPSQLDNILLQIFLFIANIIDKQFRSGPSCFDCDNILVLAVDSGPHDLTGLRNGDFGCDRLHPQSAYISVGGKFLFGRFISIISIISESIPSGYPNVKHNHSILSERISANNSIVNFPIILDIMMREPVNSLWASTEWIGMDEVVEKGWMLFPYFVGLVDGDKIVLIVFH